MGLLKHFVVQQEQSLSQQRQWRSPNEQAKYITSQGKRATINFITGGIMLEREGSEAMEVYLA